MKAINASIPHALTYMVVAALTIAPIAMQSRYLLFADYETPTPPQWQIFGKYAAA